MADNKFQTPEALARCLPMSRLQAVLSGKWKILILWYVAFYRVQRFGALLRRLDGITQSTLTRQLRELEADGFLHREVYPEVPPRVEYTLTAMGESFLPVLNHMLLWSETHLCPPDYVNPYQDGARNHMVPGLVSSLYCLSSGSPSAFWNGWGGAVFSGPWPRSGGCAHG